MKKCKTTNRRKFVRDLSISITGVLVSPAFISFASEPIPEKKLNIALCGLGQYAEVLARGFENSQFCRLNGLITGSTEKANDWKTRYNISDANIYNYENFDEIVKNTSIDLVYIVLPNSMHKEFTLRAAKAGKHVIVEKPMATSSSDCEEMINACKKANVQLAVGYRLHFEPNHLEAQNLGGNQKFGPIQLIDSAIGYSTIEPNEWRLKKEMAGGGALVNIGIYCIQASRYILGKEPVAVTAQFPPTQNKSKFSEVEESITWQLHFEGGAIATSTNTYTCNVDRLHVNAKQGHFYMLPAFGLSSYTLQTSNGPIHKPWVNQQTAQLDGIASYLLKNEPLPSHIDGNEGLKDLKVIEAIYQAAESGKEILLD